MGEREGDREGGRKREREGGRWMRDTGDVEEERERKKDKVEEEEGGEIGMRGRGS